MLVAAAGACVERGDARQQVEGAAADSPRLRLPVQLHSEKPRQEGRRGGRFCRLRQGFRDPRSVPHGRGTGPARQRGLQLNVGSEAYI